MSFLKYLYFSVAVSMLSVVSFSEKALSKDCPFDSYMVIGGKCHDLGSQEAKPTVHKTVYPTYEYEKDSSQPIVQSNSKVCSDFNYQESAQRYFERNRDTKALDSDLDGYACEHLTRTSREILTTSIWHELLSKNIAKKQASKNLESLTYYEVLDIIGFPPNASKNSRVIWEDPINDMAIKIRFHDDQIYDMKGIGF